MAQNIEFLLTLQKIIFFIKKFNLQPVRMDSLALNLKQVDISRGFFQPLLMVGTHLYQKKCRILVGFS